MALVIDASIALAWCFPDERSERTDEVLSLARRDVVVVPPHFLYEVANTLSVGRRRSRLSRAEAAAFVEALDDLEIQVDGGISPRHLLSCAEDAARNAITVYDWAYLDLARFLAAPLATLDRNLAAAARRRGVRLLEP